jgi:hypothetical protein
MTDDFSGMSWPSALFAEQFQQASEDAVESQQKLFEEFLSANAPMGSGSFSNLGAMSMGTATFKTRVQSGGRISIPDAEREALDIQEGDIVQTIVVPVKRSRSESSE